VRVRRSSSQMPVLLTEIGPFTALDALPVAALLLDRRGDIVYRNQAATALAKRVGAERGDLILQRLRDALKAMVNEGSQFPARRVVEPRDGNRHVEAEVWMNRAGPNAFVASWRDITEERGTARATESAAGELSQAATSFTSLGERLLDDAGEVSARASSVAAASEEMSASIQGIANSASAAVNATESAVQAAREASERLGKLAESSSRIGAVSKLITGIAEQTNLLALNATIEAARAGEAGKGFAVVASEVKELAQETGRATDQIARQIQSIQDQTGQASEAMARVAATIGEINEYQTTISSAVEEQTATTQSMNRDVSSAASASAMIAETIGSVAASSVQVSTGAEATATTAAELARMASQLRTLVGRFTY